jgi:hypothetical protein
VVSVFSNRALRFVAIALLAWIGLDLAAIDPCLPDLEKQPAAGQRLVGAASSADACGHPRAMPHPDHCFCHSLSTGPGSPSSPTDLVFLVRAIPGAAPALLIQPSTALYHPPPRPA